MKNVLINLISAKLIFFVFVLSNSIQATGQWELPKNKNDLNEWRNCFSTESADGNSRLYMSYSPAQGFNPQLFEVVMYGGLDGEEINDYGGLELTTCTIKNYYFDGTTKTGTYEIGDLGPAFYLPQGASRTDCSREYINSGVSITIFRSALLHFETLSKTKKISFLLKDAKGNERNIVFSMSGYQDLISQLEKTVYFSDNNWYWDQNECIYKWLTTVYNNSGYRIGTDKTISLEIRDENKILFRKSFPIKAVIEVDDIVPVELVFDIPLCLKNVQEFAKMYDWKVRIK